MPHFIKLPHEIEKMRIAGKLAAEVLSFIAPYVLPGVSTEALDRLCHEYIIEKQGAIPASLHYQGFPKATCISVNEVVCHGIPDQRRLQEGDIVNIDVAVKADGYHGDTSTMFFVGEVSDRAKHLCNTTQLCLYEAIRIVKPNLRLKKIGQQIERIAKQHGYAVVAMFCGHGIGKGYHEPPEVVHIHAPDRGLVLLVGMTFTIEPILCSGRPQIVTLADGWTAKTADDSWSAQYEHTILVTESGCEVLTLRPDEPLIV